MEDKNTYLPNRPIFEFITTMFSWYASTEDCDTEEDVFEHSGDGGDNDGEESSVLSDANVSQSSEMLRYLINRCNNVVIFIFIANNVWYGELNGLDNLDIYIFIYLFIGFNITVINYLFIAFLHWN